MTPVPAQLQRFATGRLGRFRVRADLAWDHAQSAVLHLQSDTREAILKAHRQVGKFRQELTAYRSWLPSLNLPPRVTVPELLAWQDTPLPALLLSLEPGQPLLNLKLPRQVEQDVHRLAGAFLRELHDLPFTDDDPLPLSDAFSMRLDAWSLRAAGLLPRTVISNAVSAAREVLPQLTHMTRVPCHRDFTPRNWLTDEAGGLTVIDFEHSRPDLRLADFERLYTGLWRSRPDLQEAFESGYGTELNAEQRWLLNGLAALGGLSTVAWAREHGDARFEAHGRDVLTWLGLA